jgi:hypothetical protein
MGHDFAGNRRQVMGLDRSAPCCSSRWRKSGLGTHGPTSDGRWPVRRPKPGVQAAAAEGPLT